MKQCFLFIVILFTGQMVNAQHDQVNELMDSLIRTQRVKQLTHSVRTINAVSDTTIWIESRYYDQNGNKIESIEPLSFGKFQRRVSQYDSLNRKISFKEFDRADTSALRNETKWIYLDSNGMRQERYANSQIGSQISYFFEESGDTSWLTMNEKHTDSDYRNFQKSRIRHLGDSLEITEYIRYDDELKLSGLDVYYKVTRDIDTGYLVLEGTYLVKEEEWDFLHQSREAMRDYYNNPEKYIQMQLDGAFPYEYDDEPFTYQIYNYEHQLLQDGYSIFKTTFSYNEQGQLIEETGWGPIEGEDSEMYGIIKRSISTYEYNESGLPIKVTKQNILKERTRIDHFEYEHW